MLNIEKYKEDLIQIACKTASYQKTCYLWTVFCKDNGMKMLTNSDVTACMINWLCEEYKEPILDDVGREYLKAVIRPFRCDVRYIKKIGTDASYCIYIELNNGDCADLPIFRHNEKMYKGMIANKNYTLKELGL